MNYCFATIEDMDLLVSRRLQFIEINEDCENYDSIKENCYLYFKKSFANDSCDVVLAEEGGMIWDMSKRKTEA